MLRRTLTTNGIALLALLTPLVASAQLPDAPSTVMARMRSLNLRTNPVASREAGVHTSWQPRLAAENIAWDFPEAPPSPASSNAEAEASGQQSIYRPPRQMGARGFSTSIAETRPIPGSAPVLQNACPRNTCSLAQNLMCCGAAAPSPFQLYLKSPGVVPLTARDNLRSAIKDIIDPFNLMTIGADSAFGIATDSHTPYGPGAEGIAKYAGVSLTEDMTGEFFGTFLIPSLVHQDPHYHREPFMPIKHRILHAIVQVVWTQSTTGRPMLNYANLVGGVATAVVSNTFVPGPGRQGFSSTSQRLAIAFATSPSGNLIEEFVPDFASRINLRVVIFQRILNSVSLEEGGGQ